MALMPHMCARVYGRIQCPSMSTSRRTFILALLAAAATLSAQTTADKPMLGFSAASAASQRALEAQFDAKLNRDDLREWMRRLSARPHHLGSAYDKQNAELIASLFKSWGYDTN